MTLPAIPAATLVLFRDGPSAPELLMVERAATMAFAGGATVFPGGRVDPADHALAERLGGRDPVEHAHRIAAVRETLEEAGLALGLTRDVGSAETQAMRAALAAGRPFGAMLADHGLELALDRLTPFARWRPDLPGMRNFDTRFYLAAAPRAVAIADGGETVSLGWAPATEWLARARRGEARLIFPTLRNLERLAQFGSLAAAIADANAYPIRPITPWREWRDGVEHLRIPDDLGYPITAEPVAGALRA